MRFNESKVEYASHNLSLYYGKCPHDCRYCYVSLKFRKRKIAWSIGETRINPKAFDLAEKAKTDDVTCLVVSFTSDPLPLGKKSQENRERLTLLVSLLNILEERKIPTKVLTKNAYIQYLPRLVKTPYKHIQIGLSLTTDSRNWFETNYWEGNCTSILSRLGALLALKDNKFRTWISIEPILPNTSIQRLFREIQGVEPEEIYIGKGNYIKSLEKAFSWNDLVFKLKQREFPNLHFKKELLLAAGAD